MLCSVVIMVVLVVRLLFIMIIMCLVGLMGVCSGEYIVWCVLSIWSCWCFFLVM